MFLAFTVSGSALNLLREAENTSKYVATLLVSGAPSGLERMPGPCTVQAVLWVGMLALPLAGYGTDLRHVSKPYSASVL